MKRTATGLLVGATIVFLVTRVREDATPWLGYVRATAEAAMVGAVADWFAVTALFRHPLGVPVPHTAIIPARKDDIGRGLGAFVQQNFLTASVVQERLAGISLGARLGEWLAEPEHADRVADQAAGVLRSTLETLRDEDVQESLEAAVAQRVRALEAGPVLARGIDLAVADGRHQEVLSVVLRKVAEAVVENEDLLRSRLEEETPRWLPSRVDDRIFDRVHTGLQRFLWEVAEDEDHPLRDTLDERVRRLADDLSRSPSMRARADQLKDELIDHPALREWSSTMWADLKAALLERADDPDSDLRRRLAGTVRSLGERLRDDPTLQARVDEWIATTAVEVVERSKGEVGDVIATTVARWDPAEATDRIELQVGRDLQFIRINGTVVGGLVGLVIYTVGQLVG
ncbi:DUF445 domain-containing protein [Iamia majanohamensis]|uniref:DUF445 domain-containing protein n=1 Tax=Iamia majanohamensis TaxID=467976 RepID=A0AAF0BWU7_9ACTN|nr:DUF445 domain-containing protein [Iamia majanohamensis]WCO67854.1 DUF445 domain-containing protein [Iamia majanohamensis]